MDNQQADLSDIQYFLGAAQGEAAWVRALCDLRSEEPMLSHMDVFVGPAPDDWRGDQAWSYTECVFVAKKIPVNEFAMAFSAQTANTEEDVDAEVASAHRLDLGLIQADLRLQQQRYQW